MKAYVFAGQGIQRRGMGKELFQRFPQKTAIASEILGWSLEEVCEKNVGNVLGKTEMTQPAIYVVNALAYQAAIEDGGDKPDFVLGHSLGEWNALEAAGALTFEEGLRLVKQRGICMVQAGEGAMCAVCGREFQKTLQLLEECIELFQIEIANYNSPKQIVMAGTKMAVQKAKTYLEEAGEICIMLQVSGAFHSSYMQVANDAFIPSLQEGIFQNNTDAFVVSSVTGKPYQGNYKEILTEQMVKSVRWIDSINYVIEQGCYDFEQVGEKKNLIKLIDEIKFERAIQSSRDKGV